MMHLDFLPFPPNETIVLTAVCFPVHKALLRKRSILHGRNLLPFGSKVFPYRVVLSEGNKATFTELSPLKVYQFPLEHMATAMAAIRILHTLLTLVLLNPDMSCLCKQCRSRSVGFFRSQTIWIYTVCH